MVSKSYKIGEGQFVSICNSSAVGSKEMSANMLKAMEENRIDLIVDRTFSFAETPDAFSLSGRWKVLRKSLHRN